MGMDYVPRRPRNEQAAEGYHLNWTGHTYMARLLEGLGADLSEWSGSNDGDYVKAGTCRDWAKRLRDGVAQHRIMERHVADHLMSGGFRQDPVVDGVVGLGPLSQAFDAMSAFFRSYNPSQPSGQVAVVPAVESPLILHPLEEETADWVLSFATFLEDCGGCRQY